MSIFISNIYILPCKLHVELGSKYRCQRQLSQSRKDQKRCKKRRHSHDIDAKANCHVAKYALLSPMDSSPESGVRSPKSFHILPARHPVRGLGTQMKL